MFSTGPEKQSWDWDETIYKELRRIAGYYLTLERPDHILQPTALVHETWIRFSTNRGWNWGDKTHFFACAGRIMRHILVDHARKQSALKRLGNAADPEMTNACQSAMECPEALIGIDEALQKLSVFDPRLSRIVELKFFAGLSDDEIAEILEVSCRTVNREWKVAKAWLQSRLS